MCEVEESTVQSWGKRLGRQKGKKDQLQELKYDAFSIRSGQPTQPAQPSAWQPVDRARVQRSIKRVYLKRSGKDAHVKIFYPIPLKITTRPRHWRWFVQANVPHLFGWFGRPGRSRQTPAPHTLESWRRAEEMEGKQASKLPQLANGGRKSSPTGTARRDGRVRPIRATASNQDGRKPPSEAAGLILRGPENVRRGVLNDTRGNSDSTNTDVPESTYPTQLISILGFLKC